MMGSQSIGWKMLTAALFLFLAGECQAADRYPASGIVLRVDRPGHSVQVSCREIPGFMAAMVMDFAVRNAQELDGLSPGIMIDFTLAVSGDSAYAESIRIH